MHSRDGRWYLPNIFGRIEDIVQLHRSSNDEIAHGPWNVTKNPQI